MPDPALVSTITSWPAATSSATDGGVSPTRYSWFLISLGTPTRIISLQKAVCCTVLDNSSAGRESLQSLRRWSAVTHGLGAVCRPSMKIMQLDRIDSAILQRLAGDARASVSQI